ncbi:MAG TPA: fluoride efflux transporter CrcB [Actinomycetota bacterium]|nr:fluoride efflux transporter CrcB [Actinomycetota bacterium]
MRTIWVGIAGFFGAIARYTLGGFIAGHTRGAFPWETLVINVSGCFALGFIFTVLTERFMPDPTMRIALTVGFLGAYTTFSTFAFETMRLAQDGAMLLASINVVSSVGAGLLAVYAGTWAGRAL